MGDLKNQLKIYHERLNEVSPSFCLAKWLQVTVHLQMGQTHSCHHPVPHRIPLEEIKKNPAALHNTEFKKQQRKQMLEGKRPAECDYCWAIEDSAVGALSDRVLKSHETWAQGDFERIAGMPWDQDIHPRYLELSFSHGCNFKCSYCSPSISSAWEKEITEFGAYSLSRTHNSLELEQHLGRTPIQDELNNPYIAAFWKWWPDVYQDLRFIRVTGGEPLLSKNTFYLLESVAKTPHSNLTIAVNSNLGVPANLISKLIEKLHQVSEGVGPPKRFEIFTSLDSWGEQAAYIRHGMVFQQVWDNMIRVLEELPAVQLTIMCTFTNLSVPSFRTLLEKILELKQRFSSGTKRERFTVDISYIRFPLHQSLLLLPKEYLLPKLEECCAFMRENLFGEHGRDYGFVIQEIVKMERLLDFARNSNLPELTTMKIDFYRFFQEHDRRRGTNFLALFPELEFFWLECADLSRNS